MVISKLANGEMAKFNNKQEAAEAIDIYHLQRKADDQARRVAEFRARRKGTSVDLPKHYEKAVSQLRKAGTFYRYRSE